MVSITSNAVEILKRKQSKSENLANVYKIKEDFSYKVQKKSMSLENPSLNDNLNFQTLINTNNNLKNGRPEYFNNNFADEMINDSINIEEKNFDNNKSDIINFDEFTTKQITNIFNNFEDINKHKNKNGFYSSLQNINSKYNKNKFNPKKLKNYYIKFNIDGNTKDFLFSIKDDLRRLESDLQKNISYEGEINIIDRNDLADVLKQTSIFNVFVPIKKYLIVNNNFLYLYDKKESYNKYEESYLLTSCHVKGVSKVVLTSITYYIINIYFANNQNVILFSKSSQRIVELTEVIRKTVYYTNYFDKYNIISEIGSGSYGRVYLSYDLISNNQSATKIIAKKDIKSHFWLKIKGEIDILKILDHPCVIKLFECFENSEYYFIVTEYLQYGSLAKLMEKRVLNEKAVAKIIYQLAIAVQYIQKKGIIHKDIKPANILLATPENNKDYKIKLIDFGIAKILGVNEKICESSGSFPFCAPELLLNQKYDYSVDIWAIGINAFLLLTNKFPFKSHGQYNNKLKLLEIICHKKINFDPLKYNSKEVNDFIQKCLNKDPNKRINIDELINHPWLANMHI